MDATIVPKMQKHYPVLLKEIISVISPQHGGTFIDCTFGQGGYSKKILDFKNTKVIAIDRDIESCLLYTSPSPRDRTRSRMPSSA